MKTILFKILLVGSITFSIFAFGVYCPVCNGYMTWTGKTQIEWGKMLKEYKCLNNHCSWIVQ